MRRKTRLNPDIGPSLVQILGLDVFGIEQARFTCSAAAGKVEILCNAVVIVLDQHADSRLIEVHFRDLNSSDYLTVDFDLTTVPHLIAELTFQVFLITCRSFRFCFRDSNCNAMGDL